MRSYGATGALSASNGWPRVLAATPQQIADLAASMGLPPPAAISAGQEKRSYITVIRRNWHLLPYEQLLDLLGWDAAHLAYILKEDDFLWHKLGAFKPECAPVWYVAASPGGAREGREDQADRGGCVR